MMERDQVLRRYSDWCMRIQNSEAERGFSTLLWVGGPDVEASFAYADREAVHAPDLFALLLAEEMRRNYDVEMPMPECDVLLDHPKFHQFRIAYLREKLLDVDFAYIQMLRTRNRKRDRAIAREIQASLEVTGWKKYRSTPSELGATLMVESNIELEIQLSLPHGSLEFEYILRCGTDAWLWRESYISWFGLAGPTAVWGSTKDPENLCAFIVDQTKNLQGFLESCRDCQEEGSPDSRAW